MSTEVQLSKQEIIQRIDAFVSYVQDCDQHKIFSPGLKWWSVSESSQLSTIIPNYVGFLEQIGVMVSEMEKAFGKFWKANIENNFPGLRTRRFLGNYLFVSPRDIIEFDSSQTPTRDNIVRKSSYSLGNYNRSWTKLQSDISRAFPRTKVKSDISHALPRSAAIIIENKSNVTSTTTTTTTTIKASGTCTRATTTTTTFSGNTVLAETTTTTATGSEPLIKAPDSTQLTPSSVSVTGKVSELTNQLITLRKEGSQLIADKELMTRLRCLGNEVFQILGGKRSSEVVIQSAKGSVPQKWVRVIKPRLGCSDRTTRRVAKTATTFAGKLTEGRASFVSKEINSKIANHLSSEHLVTHVRGRPLLIPSATDQMMLQQAGGMSDRQMLAVNQLMIKLTGFAIHSKKNTLTALVEGDMCDYRIFKENVLVNGTLQERRVFRMNRICDVIKDRVHDLFKNSVFVPSSSITGLDDSTIIVRLGGDKGGKTMAFKFGLTVMNCLQPNLPENFDLIATVEAFDVYHNLKTAIFDHYRSELHWLCQTGEGHEPSVIAVFKKMDYSKSILLVELFTGQIGSPLLHDVVEVDENTLEIKPDFFGSELGCSLVDHCTFCSKIDSDDIVGLAFVDSSGNVVAVNRFRNIVRKADFESLTFEQFNMHVVLNADLEFIHTVLGLQSCSATYPCCFCLIKLDDLRGQRSIESGVPRSREQMQKNLEQVNKGVSLAQKKRAAQTNGSVIREPLIPISMDRVMLPILHIILGVVKKLWDNLVAEIHALESGSCVEIKMLIEARDNLAKHTSILAEIKEQVYNNYSIIEKQRKETSRLYTGAKNQSTSAIELQSIQIQYELLRLKAKEAEEKKKKVNAKEIDFYATMVKDVNNFLRQKQGPIERALEYIISAYPISAKHNPYYGGSFNGNDCMRMLENVPLIFQTLFDTINEAVSPTAVAIIQCHHDIWESFASIAPLLRSRRKFTQQQQEDLLHDTLDFAQQYKQKSSCNVTYKMHILFAHLQRHLATYETVGLFSEDSMESIHAAINRLDRVYASLNSERKTKAILQSLTATKKRSLAKQNVQVVKSAKTEEAPIAKQKRRQGIAKKNTALAPFVDVPALLAPSATQALRDWNWSTNEPEESDYPGSHLQYDEILCEHCHVHLNRDERISLQLSDLHYLLQHVHTDNKYNVSKTEL
jgi:hypothetical protein